MEQEEGIAGLIKEIEALKQSNEHFVLIRLISVIRVKSFCFVLDRYGFRRNIEENGDKSSKSRSLRGSRN